MPAYQIRITLCLLALGTPAVTWGQSGVADSSVSSPSDSSRAPIDTVGDTTASQDSLRTRSQSADSAADTARAAGTRDSTGPAAMSVPLVDSILARACSGSTGSTAPDLLVVTFAAEAGPADRASVARSVHGKVLGPVTGEPGAYYVGVPAQRQESRLRAAADELIRSQSVHQVGSRICPPLPTADTSGPDTAAQRLPKR